MKHQSYPRSTKTKFQDPKLADAEHKKVASTRKHHPACEPVQKKPLAGRIFYLDLPCNKRTQALETDIKSLGGTVEKFFSKEIRYLVSNKPEARHVQRLIHDSPVPSPDSGLSSPHPGSRRDSHGHRGSSQGPADTVFVSRGKSLVEKVVKEQERFQMNRILANALEWGVKILHIDDVVSYVDKKKSTIAKVRAATHSVKKAPEHTDGTASQKSKAGRMSRPFVKVEDFSRHYRPLYLHMANMPVCNLRSAAPCSPFLEENDKDEPGKKTKVHRSGGDRREKSRKDRHRGREGKGRRKGGYCECCIVKYDNLKAHLQSEQHQTFSTSEEYLVVDRVISGLTCDFVHISPQMKRVKCSVTSPLIIPGPVVRKDRETGVEEEDVTDETPLWSSYNTERSARKRSRELSHSPKGDLAGQSGAFQKSQLKRGSFEWESSSNAALQKDFGTPLCNTRQECLSERLERTGTSSHTLSERRTSQSRLSVRLSDPAGFNVTRSSLGAGTSHVVSESPAVLDIQTVPKLLLDARERTTERPDCNTSITPNVAHHPVTETLSSSDTGIPSGVLKRKVRAWRRKRNTPSESMGWIFVDFPVESQTLQGLREDSKSHTLSASALDLGGLFQSSDDMEEDFKGF